MSYEKYKVTIKATNEARRDAVRVLIDMHRDEFDAIYLVKARERGLNPTKIASQVKKVEVAKKEREDFDKAVGTKVAEIIEQSSISKEELSELL